MKTGKRKPRYGLYGVTVYMLSLACIVLPGLAIAALGFSRGVRGLVLLGLSIILYGVVSTFGWFLARYVIPRWPVTLARSVIDTLELKGTEVVLDVGTGRGLFAIETAKRLTTGTVTGIDVWEPDRIDRALHHHKWAQPTGNTMENALRNAELEGVQGKVRFENMDATGLGFDPGTFDVVICGYVLGHLGDHAEAALKEMHRVQKPGGKLLVVDIVRDFTFFLMSTPHLFLLSYLRGKKARRLTEAYWLSVVAGSGFHIESSSKRRGIIVLTARPAAGNPG